MQKRKAKRRRSSRKKGRLNLVKRLMKNKDAREIIIEAIRILIEIMKG